VALVLWLNSCSCCLAWDGLGAAQTNAEAAVTRVGLWVWWIEITKAAVSMQPASFRTNQGPVYV
jgi:hypothetical protein